MGHESEREEWKRVWNDKCLENISAFANADGGVLIIGKNDDGSMEGVSNASKLMDDVPNIVYSKFGFLPRIERVAVDGKECIEVYIKPQSRPISLDGRFYIRSGSTTRELSGKELEDLIMERRGITWTDFLAIDVEVKDLSEEAIGYMANLGIDKGRLPRYAVSEGPVPLLKHFDLLDGKAMRKACAILFHPEPDRVVLGSYIEIGVFSAEGKLLREDTVKCPAIMQPEAAVNLIYEKHIQGTYRIDGLFRETDYAYPRVAVREALTNAIVHRDYSVFLPTAVSIYPDSLEILNYGGLPQGWTVDDLLAKHSSVPRNFRMARVFHDAGLIEKWGTGINTIFNACREAGVADPEYSANNREVRVTFRSNVEGVRGAAKRGEGVTDNEMQILSLIGRSGGMTGMEIRAASPMGETAAKYVVATLSKKGLIVKKDGKRKDKWVLSEEGEKHL